MLWVLIAACRLYAGKDLWTKLVIANTVTAVLISLFLGSLIFREGFESVQLVYRFSTAHSSLGSFSQKMRDLAIKLADDLVGGLPLASQP